MEHQARLLADVLATTRLALAAAIVALLATACGAPHRRASVPIDQRPTPAQPDTSAATPAPPSATLSSKTVQQSIGEVVRDTSAARIALDRCAGRKLLPEQEAVVDGTETLLIQVRQALAAQDFTRARRLAREARSLAASSPCR